jgi:hypothetical protein
MFDIYDFEDREVSEAVDVPGWIDSGVTVGQVMAIIEGGSASGAYMPAVTYSDARKAFFSHESEVMDYIEDAGLTLLDMAFKVDSISALVCAYMSLAVELWCGQNIDDISDHFEYGEAE